MKVYSALVDNNQDYEDYSSVNVLIAADTPEEADAFIRKAIEDKVTPFDRSYTNFEDGVGGEPNLLTDLTEIGVITYFHS